MTLDAGCCCCCCSLGCRTLVPVLKLSKLSRQDKTALCFGAGAGWTGTNLSTVWPTHQLGPLRRMGQIKVSYLWRALVGRMTFYLHYLGPPVHHIPPTHDTRMCCCSPFFGPTLDLLLAGEKLRQTRLVPAYKLAPADGEA